MHLLFFNEKRRSKLSLAVSFFRSPLFQNKSLIEEAEKFTSAGECEMHANLVLITLQAIQHFKEVGNMISIWFTFLMKRFRFFFLIAGFGASNRSLRLSVALTYE